MKLRKLLPEERITSLCTAAIRARLTEQRDVLFANVSKHFASGLPRTPATTGQLLIDLHRMNEMLRLADGSVPLEGWLAQAVLLTVDTPEHEEFRGALDEVRRASSRPAEPEADGRREGPRRHFLDERSFDFRRAEAQALWALLEQNLVRIEDTITALDKAGLSKSRIHLEQAPRARWREVLESAANQGRARQLVESIAADPEWAGLRDRLHELLGSAPPIDPGSGRIEWKAREPAQGEERLQNKKPTWVDVAFLNQGLACATSVVRISAFFGDSRFLGTGFFVAPGRVLTNHHVLFNNGVKADRVVLWFDYELRPDGSLPRPDEVTIEHPEIQGDKARDWATLEVSDERATRAPALKLGANQAVKPGDHVSIIQHPHGLPKKLGIFNSEVRHVDDEVLQYLTDTEQGSSGSPVFNQRWEVVGLHHMWTTVASDRGEPEIRNEGILMDRVIEALRGRKLLP